MIDNCKIKELVIYPVKSCAGIKLKEMAIGELGPLYDRQWMLVDAKANFVTQRTHPQMALIKTQLLDHKQTAVAATLHGQKLALSLSLPGGESFIVDDEFAKAPDSEVEIWKDRVMAISSGPKKAEVTTAALNSALSDFLKMPVRLMQVSQKTRRKVANSPRVNNNYTGFADGYPLLLIGTASLKDLSEKIGESISPDRFRANLVVDTEIPFEEETWQTFTLGTIDFVNAKLCSRCVMLDIDPATAEKKLAVLKTLASYRKQGNKVHFGINLLHLNQGSLFFDCHSSF